MDSYFSFIEEILSYAAPSSISIIKYKKDSRTEPLAKKAKALGWVVNIIYFNEDHYLNWLGNTSDTPENRDIWAEYITDDLIKQSDIKSI